MQLVHVFLLISLLILAGYAADSDDNENEVLEITGPDNGQNNEEEYGEDDYNDNEGEYSDDGATGYSASVSEFQWRNNLCYREVTVSGPGFDDVIPIDCYADDFVLANNTMLVVGSSLYSDSPNTLVVVRGTWCEQRTYSDDEDPPARTRLSLEECAAVSRAMLAAWAEGVLGTHLQGPPGEDAITSSVHFGY